MRFDGEWLLCDDGTTRPVLRAEVFAGNDNWHSIELLLDTGADRTVLSTNVLRLLDLPFSDGTAIAGIGGTAGVVTLETKLLFTRDGGKQVTFRGEYAACKDPETLDMSVLGRDILDMLAVVVDRPGGVVCLLGQRHGYVIEELTT